MDPDSDHLGGGQAQQKALWLDKIEQAAKIFATAIDPDYCRVRRLDDSNDH